MIDQISNAVDVIVAGRGEPLLAHRRRLAVLSGRVVTIDIGQNIAFISDSPLNQIQPFARIDRKSAIALVLTSSLTTNPVAPLPDVAQVVAP